VPIDFSYTKYRTSVGHSKYIVTFALGRTV